MDKPYWIALLFCTLLFSGCFHERTAVYDLKCRNRVDPEGIDKASFSWKIASGQPDMVQSGWEIEIASGESLLKRGRADVWRSGPVVSGEQLFIEPRGALLRRGTPYWWRVRIRDAAGETTAWSDPAFFSLGPGPDDWQARWITAAWEENMPLPYLRRRFTVGKGLERAVVHLCGLGCSDLYLNGERVDESRVLDPAQTNYEQYALYSTFDITSSLDEGENCLGVMLGDGWYNQDRVWENGSYGKPMLLAQLEMTFADGSRQVLGTDPSWEWHPGPVLSSNLYAGEMYDANCEIPGWSEPGASSAGWRPALPASGIIPPELRPQLMEPIRLQEPIPAQRMWLDSSGNWIYDFGVNIAGVPRLNVEQPKGTVLTMRMGESLHDDGSVNFSSTGTYATHVIPTERYVCKGAGPERWNPRFTYHGFRYLELSGAVTPPGPDWVCAVPLHTDALLRGTFECTDPQINRLHEMAMRSARSNLHGLPTDCPQREKCGWLGDAHAIAPFLSMNFDLNNFWEKYLEDIRSTSASYAGQAIYQKAPARENYVAEKRPGIPYNIAPGRRLSSVALPDWGTAVVQLPWFVYQYYGNREPLELYYETMKTWVAYLDSLATGHIVPYGLGDWCPPEGRPRIDCPVPLSSTAFHYRDVWIVAETARLLGRTEEAAFYTRLREMIRQAFVARFYDPLQNSFGSQTADALALDFGLVPPGDEEAVCADIVKNMHERHHGFFHTGIFGLARVGQALARYGNAQAAWQAFTKQGEYSFAWMWTGADATTLWEVLPVSEKSREIAEIRMSQNHVMQGAYDAFFYEDIAGMRPDPSGPGYRVTRFEPLLTDCLDGAGASIETPYGRTASQWRRKGECLEWRVTIPPNTSGLVALPKDRQVSIGGKNIEALQLPVIESRPQSNLYRFGSGVHRIWIGPRR